MVSLKIAMVLWTVLLYVKELTEKVKLLLGLVKMEYGMASPFKHKGVLFSSWVHTPERIQACELYDRFRPDDLVMAAYPKSGTHFVNGIVISIYKAKGLIPKNASYLDVTTALDLVRPSFAVKSSKDGRGPLADMEGNDSPRIIGTHLPWNLLPLQVKEGKVKVIHCMRNPKDVICSAYPFYKKVGVVSVAVKWMDFVQWFIEGNVDCGSYFKYLREWYANRTTPNLLNLQYEDLKKDQRANVIKIAEFLDLELTEQQIDSVVAANTFASKKKEMGSYNPVYRAGKSGGWRSDITVEQNEMLDEWIQQEMVGMEDLEIQYD